MEYNTPALNAALVAALSETTDVHADSTNPFHKSKYASLGAHLAAIKPVFAKHGLAIIQFPVGYDNGVGVKTIVMHKSGETIGFDIMLSAPKVTSKEGVTKQGYTAQEAGSVISYLRRYSLASVAGVATDDDDAEVTRTSVSSQSVTKTNYIPNPTAKPAYTGKGGDTQFIVPFGDCKGQPLSTLPMKSNDKSKKCGDLYYWANVWKPKPFGDNPEPSPKDIALKAEAQRLYAVAESGPAEAEEVAPDDVPF